MKTRAAQVGLVLGAIFIVMGLGSSNSTMWMLGAIVLAIGLVSARTKRSV